MSSQRETEPVPVVEPDLVGVWSKHGVYLFGLRIPFSLVFLSWVTAGSHLSTELHWDRYLLGLVAVFFGVVGAHYIDTSKALQKGQHPSQPQLFGSRHSDGWKPGPFFH